MHKEMAELCIGAFLHDIGKISERAMGRLSPQSEGMKDYICPKDRVTQRFGYLHTAHTNEFFESLKNWLPRELDPAVIANIACYHHMPDADNWLQLVVQEADRLSAGQDRSQDDNQPGRRDYGVSIFSSLQKPDTSSTLDESVYILPLIPLSLDAHIYPQLQQEAAQNALEDYKHLWQMAFKQFSRLQPTAPELFLEQLIWVFGLYGSCVPSHRTQHFQISLLDHSLTTAAFATALYQYHHQTNTLNEQSIKDRVARKFRMVSGDLSGIQSYLYHTTLENPSGVSKRLRSKSFYLGLLTRLAGNLLLERLGLPSLNRIIDAGGNFTLLIHNTPESLACVQQTEQEIQQWFQKAFRGKLYLNLCYDMEISGEDFSSTRFHIIQQKLSWKMDCIKRRPLRSILTSNGKWKQDVFLLPFDPSQIPSEMPDTKRETLEDQFFNELGSQLTAGNFLKVSQKPFDGAFSPSVSDLCLANPLGQYYFAIADSPSGGGEIQSCVEFVPGKQRKELQQIRCGLFMANYVPRQTEADRPVYQTPEVSNWLQGQLKEEEEGLFSLGQRKSFAHLCADGFAFDRDGKPKGQPLLAVLKADVDRMGMLFSKGLEDSKASLSYYISLSRQLDLFFRGILPNIFLEPPKEHPDFRNIYTVYAGGDDLLLVGPWRTLLAFSVYMQQQFRSYVCQHPSITLSAGMTVCHSRFPLSQAASQADAALSKAKEHRNQVCVFDTVLNWPDLEIALDDAIFLDRIMAEGGADGIEVKKSFVYRLIRYCQMEEESRSGKLKSLLWRSHLCYDMARNVKIHDRNNGKPPGLERLEKMTALTKDPGEMARLKVAVTYCLYLNR
ncbi:MAG TPA: type III-A CRISPR-associated protein Cas10/Csm1 [Anaerohalosphaeraceae bacterium]|nr:type III-A CRISPR-associated protein Cas10/Csm1 [Anaerohalosphaeraceae bacterium]